MFTTGFESLTNWSLSFLTCKLGERASIKLSAWPGARANGGDLSQAATTYKSHFVKPGPPNGHPPSSPWLQGPARILTTLGKAAMRPGPPRGGSAPFRIGSLARARVTARGKRLTAVSGSLTGLLCYPHGHHDSSPQNSSRDAYTPHLVSGATVLPRSPARSPARSPGRSPPRPPLSA